MSTDWTTKAAQQIVGSRDLEYIASVIATHAAPLVAELAEQRAELTGRLSEAFQAVPACYDTPADHYREMARRIVEDRDMLKHRERALVSLLRESKREHQWDEEEKCDKLNKIDPAEKVCTCGAEAFNAKIDAALAGRL